MNTKTSTESNSAENKGLTSQELNSILSVVDEIRSSRITKRNNWIYKSIVEKIHEVSIKECDPQSVLSNILSDYEEEVQINESFIKVWPEEATSGKENKRIENENLSFKISFIQAVAELYSSERELSSVFFKVDLFRKGIISLESVEILKKKGINPRNLLEYIKKKPHISHVIALFHHLGFLEYILKQYQLVDHIGVSKEIHSWIGKRVSYDSVRRAVKHFMLNEEYDKEYDSPLEKIKELFPL